MKIKMQNDFDMCNHGSVFTLDPNNPEATEWIIENLPDAAPWGSGVVIEHGYVNDILDGIDLCGYTVSIQN